jgi:hypothetical protein
MRGGSQAAVSGHQHAIAQEWRSAAAQETTGHRARMLAELAKVRTQAWLAWFEFLETGQRNAALSRAISDVHREMDARNAEDGQQSGWEYASPF